MCGPASENFCASSDPQQNGTPFAPASMDGSEPTAIHGARPTTSQFLMLGTREQRSYPSFYELGSFRWPRVGTKHSQTPARPLSQKRTTGSRIVFPCHGSCDYSHSKSTELSIDPQKSWFGYHEHFLFSATTLDSDCRAVLPNRTFIRQDTFQATRSRLARGDLNNDNVARFEPGLCRALLIGYQGSHISFHFQ